MKKDLIVIIGALIITALIVGFGVYQWNQPIKELPKSPVKLFNASAILD
ncbi:hypothetical protein JW758_03625 [Candidatus Peregrinibacteria bacterium]|nr:hypothetical protein [Candidatus Peregrinibacteria bacterium]